MSNPPRETVFRSAGLHAVFSDAGGEGRPLVVTFDSLNHDLSLERAGFGEDWLRASGFDAVHVLAARNDWYQDADMAGLFAAVRARGAGRPRVVTYGSSMGGYGAVRFAGRLGASTAVAISPQLSVDPARAPFDSRWVQHGRRLRFLWEEPAPEDAGLREAWVFYDPHDLDRRHMEALGALYPVRPLPVRHGGHPAGGLLAEGGLLASSVVAMIEGRFTPEGWASAVRRARRRSGQYFFTLAQRQPERRLPTAVRLAEAAVALSPSAPYLSLHGRLLEQAGDAAGGEALQRRAVALEPAAARFRVELAALLARAGREGEAADLVEPLLRLEVAEASLYARACALLVRAGRHREALALARAGRARLPHAAPLAAWAQRLAFGLAVPGAGALWLAALRARARVGRPRAVARALRIWRQAMRASTWRAKSSRTRPV